VNCYHIFYQYGFRVYRPRGIYRIVTAEPTVYTVLVVVPAYTTRPHIQLSDIGLGGHVVLTTATCIPIIIYYWWGATYVTRYCGHFWPIVQPQMIDEGDCGVIGGMEIGRGNRSTRRKPAPAPFCPPQIPLDQTRARTRAAAVGSQRLTA
jgi:hypothetical protein